MIATRTLDFTTGKLLVALQMLFALGTFKLELVHKSFRFVATEWWGITFHQAIMRNFRAQWIRKVKPC
jgi:hypothetical protein